MKATDLLKKDHAAVKKLFTQFGKTTSRARKTRAQLIDKICGELDVHAKIEEEIFYPAMQQISEARTLLEDAREEHETMKGLIGELSGMAPTDKVTFTKVKELREAVLEHATEEERRMFPLAQRLGAEQLDRLGERLDDRKRGLGQEMRKAA